MTICRPIGYVVSFVTTGYCTTGTFADEFHTWYAEPSRKRYTIDRIQETLDYFKRK